MSDLSGGLGNQGFPYDRPVWGTGQSRVSVCLTCLGDWAIKGFRMSDLSGGLGNQGFPYV